MTESMMTSDENKLQILKKVENGTLSIEEGADLLSILDRNESGEETSAPLHGDVVEVEKLDALPEKVPAGWKALWGIFMWLGVIFMTLSGFWLYSSYNRSAMGVGFWFAMFFLFLSTAIVLFGWRLVAEHWMVIRIRSKEEGKKGSFMIWAPLPIHMALWIFRTFGSKMPAEVQGRKIDEILAELNSSLAEGEVLQVDLDGDGNHTFNMHADF
jgi:hypothetical protein